MQKNAIHLKEIDCLLSDVFVLILLLERKELTPYENYL